MKTGNQKFSGRFFTTASERATQALAKKFAQTLKGGEVICLLGDLGSGKTAFTKGLAAGLGVKHIVTSPTFVLMKVYPAKFNRRQPIAGRLVHIDAYRLTSGRDLAAIGATDYFTDPRAITVIEWAERVKKIWPRGAKVIEFKVKGEKQRQINFK